MTTKEMISAILRLSAEVEALRGQLSAAVVRPAMQPLPYVRYGKVVTTWTTGNHVHLTPCDVDGNATGDPEVQAYIDSPVGAAPAGVELSTNNVLAYTFGPDGTAYLFPVKQGASVGGTTIPTPTVQYTLLMCMNQPSEGVPAVLGWSFPRLHG